MMKSMDAGIGRVLKALERAKLERDTLVIFTSDNGGERYSYNWPFSFQKMYLYEGGTRVPAIVRWPGVIPAGRVTEQAAITMDWTATILAVTGTAADPAFPLDGENLMPVCTGAARRLRSHAVLAHRRACDAARVGSWKYLKDDGRRVSVRSGGRSRARKTTAARSDAGTFERIKQQYLAWNAQMLPRPATVADNERMRERCPARRCCSSGGDHPVPSHKPAAFSPMNTIAERYVKLVLAVGQHDADYVDAFYGPRRMEGRGGAAEAAARRDRRRRRSG